MKRFVLAAFASVAGLAGLGAAPALALGPVIVPCALTDISPNAVACSGFYQGNLIAGSPGARADQQAALALIGYTGPAITAAFFGAAPKDSTGDGNANFGVPLFGDTWIAIHFGAGTDGPVSGFTGGGTAFYRLNLGAVTPSIALNWGAGSTAILYQTGVIPEPATWAMLIAGFGLVGSTMRRRRETVASVRA